jgi:hypothetical protein
MSETGERWAAVSIAEQIEAPPFNEEELDRLLVRLRGEWNAEVGGYWPAVDAMNEAAAAIAYLRRERVPRVPTEGMVNAGAYVDIANIGENATSPYDHVRMIWCVMYNAAKGSPHD